MITHHPRSITGPVMNGARFAGLEPGTLEAVGKGAPVVPPPGVSRPQAVRCGAGWSGDFGGGTSGTVITSASRRWSSWLGLAPGCRQWSDRRCDGRRQEAGGCAGGLGASFLAARVGRAAGSRLVCEVAGRHDGHRGLVVRRMVGS